MNLYIENNIQFDHLMFLGDTHGNNQQIAPHLLGATHIPKDEPKAIIHVGDFGVGFCKTFEGEIQKLYILNNRLKKYNVTLYVVRGNHDDPAFFNKPYAMNTMVDDEIIENIVFLPDHTLLTLELKGKDQPIKIYCNGGAISIDRTHRTTGRSYWLNEKFNLPTLEQLDEIPNDIDVIVTHTRPLGVMPIGKEPIKHWFLEDSQLEVDLNNETQDMWIMFDSIREKNKLSGKEISHFYGHFHMHLTGKTNHMKHIGLDIDELYEYRI